MNGNDPTKLTKLALLIDGDNVHATLMPEIMRQAAALGSVAIRRIYGQFTGGKMKSWQKRIAEFDLTEVNVTPARSGKNATDIKLVIEAVDMLHGRRLDGVCIASSDSDFTPLAARVRANAVSVYGFGEKKAPKAYKDAFDKFFELDSEKPAPMRKAAARPNRTEKVKPAKPAPSKAPQANAAKPDIPVTKILAAIDKARGADGRAHVRAVGNALHRAIPGFKARDYGYKTMTDLLAGLPEVVFTKEGGGAHVRRRQS